MKARYFLLFLPLYLIMYAGCLQGAASTPPPSPSREEIIPIHGPAKFFSGLLFYAYTSTITGRTTMYDITNTLTLAEVTYFDNYFREHEEQQRAEFEGTLNNRPDMLRTSRDVTPDNNGTSPE